jgi:fumarate reductase subunit C
MLIELQKFSFYRIFMQEEKSCIFKIFLNIILAKYVNKFFCNESTMNKLD